MKRTAAQRHSSPASLTSTDTRSSSGPASVWPAGLWGLALCVVCTLWLASPEPIPIFVSRRLLAIHFLFAIPLGMLVGDTVRRRWSHPWVWTTVAIACSLVVVVMLPVWSDALLPTPIGFALRWGVRSAVAVGLSILWCAASPRLGRRPEPSKETPSQARRKRVCLAAAFAMVTTWIYSREVLFASIDAAQRDIASPWVERSARSLQQAVELDDLAMIGGLPAKQQWLERLRTLQELQLRLDALDNARDSRSVSESVPLLLALGRSREAVARLQSLDSRTPTSHLLEAIGFSDLQDWQSLLVACHRSQGLLDQFQPDEKQRWFELRSEALTRLRRTAEALECLREAAIECPTAAPMFSMQAALQCAELGDVPAALEELRSIRVQHPDMAIAIDRQVRRLQTQSCTLPPAWRFGAPNTSAR